MISLNKNKPVADRTTDQHKKLILQIVKKENIKTTKQLVTLMHDRHSLPEKQTFKLLMELENEDKIHFAERPLRAPTSLKNFVFSKRVTWFWIMVVLAFSMVVAVFTIPESAYPFVYVRYVLGALFVLYLPGYSFIKSLFLSNVQGKNGSEDLDEIERVALCLGMSLVLSSLTGLVLGYTPWGIGLTTVTLGLFVLTVIFGIVAILREYHTYQLKATQTKYVQKKHETFF